MSLKLSRFPQTQPSWSLMQQYLNKMQAALEENDAAQEQQLADITALQTKQAEIIADLTAVTNDLTDAVNNINATMPDIAPVTITADYTGTINAGQLPRSVQAYRYDGVTDVTALSAWSVSASSGITATVGASTGLVSITGITASGTITVTSVHNSISRSKTIVVTLSVASAPDTGSGGGTSATDTSFASFNSTTHAAVSNELTVTVGTSGEVQLSAPLIVYTDEVAPNGVFAIYAVWQWWNGAAWADQGVEVLSSPHCLYDGIVENGAINAAYLKTGLAASASEKFRLMARNSSGSRIMYLSGEASAVAT